MTQEKSIYQKLVEIQANLKAPKNQFNKFGGYHYRSAEDIVDAVKPLLYERGLFQTITDEVVNIGDRYYVKATVSISDGQDSITVDAYAREIEDKKGAEPSQITGATSSYARKYAMNGLFAIDDNKDSDATNTHDKGSKGSNPNKTQNLKQATQETKSEPEDELTDQKSRTAYTVALGEFQGLETQGQIKQQGKKIMDKARKNGLKEGDENKLRQEINQLMETLPEKKEDAEPKGDTNQSTEQSGEGQG